MEYCSLIRIFDFVEDRLHLGNTKKNEFSFGISLDLHYLCTQNRKKETIMEEKKFKNRREQADYYAKLRGWGPLTEEDKIALDDAVRLITNLDSKPRYAAVSH